MDEVLYDRIKEDADEKHMSVSGWMNVAAEEKLANEGRLPVNYRKRSKPRKKKS